MTEAEVRPRIVECPTCHAPVPATDTLCYRCGDLIPNEVLDALR